MPIRPPSRRHARRRTAGRMLMLAALAVISGAGAGCVIAPFLRASELHGSKTIPAKYTGLAAELARRI